MNKEDLIFKIKNVFSNEKYIGDDLIVYNNSIKHNECRKLKSAFLGKKWEEINHSTIFEYRDDIYFFSKKGLKYYLPALLIDILEDIDETDNLVDNLLSLLIVPLEIDTLILGSELNKYSSYFDKEDKISFDNILQKQLEIVENRLSDFMEFVNLFNIEQKKVIYTFLEYLNENFSNEFIDPESPQTAIKRYWFQYKSLT